MKAWINEIMNEWKHEWVNEIMNEIMKAQMNGWTVEDEQNNLCSN